MAASPVRDSATARLEAVVRGSVQGVGYRVFVRRAARELDLVGWVANQPDGSVRCVAEGPREGLVQLVAVLRRGPIGSRVTAVTEAWSAPNGRHSDFSIRAGAHPGD
jgi:acylphosphatase